MGYKGKWLNMNKPDRNLDRLKKIVVKKALEEKLRVIVSKINNLKRGTEEARNLTCKLLESMILNNSNNKNLKEKIISAKKILEIQENKFGKKIITKKIQRKKRREIYY